MGLLHDADFGPLLMIAAGGFLIELLAERRIALPPVDRALARAMLGELSISKLLTGYRGRAPADIDAFADCVVALSRLALDLGDLIAELDVNPVIVNADGALAVDALLVTRAGAS